MITGPVNAGKGSVGINVSGGLPGIWNSIVSAPLVTFASRIACRRDPAPLSLVVVTVKVAPRTVCNKKTKLACTAIPGGSLKPHNGCFPITKWEIIPQENSCARHGYGLLSTAL